MWVQCEWQSSFSTWRARKENMCEVHANVVRLARHRACCGRRHVTHDGGSAGLERLARYADETAAQLVTRPCVRERHDLL